MRWRLLIFLLSIPTFAFLLLPRTYYNMQDDMQVIRQLEFEKCLQDGQIPCRWTPDLGYGYGYPLFNYYPPLPSIVGQVFRLFGSSFLSSVKLSAVLSLILAPQFMFTLGRSLFGPIGGFLSAIFYAYVPYHALNIYVRGAFNEMWAATFFPLIFYFLQKFLISKFKTGYLGLSLSLAGLLLSHNPMAMVISPAIVFFTLFFLWPNLKLLKQPRNIFLFLKPFILTLTLTAFFTLPVLFETKLVQIDSMFKNYYDFKAHFVSLYQLFISNFWGDGPSIWGPNDGMSFSVGYLHWLIPLVTFFLVTFLFFKKRSIKFSPLFFGFIFLALIYLFLTHERSTPIWLILPPLAKIQFPWRLLNPLSLILSLLVGFLSLYLSQFNRRLSFVISICLTVGVIVLNFSHFHPVVHGPLTDQQKFSGESWTRLVTASIYDYLPNTASTAAKAPAKDFLDEINPNNPYELTGAKRGTDWMFFNLKVFTKSDVTLSELAFPNFKVFDNSKLIGYQIEPTLGRIKLTLTAGDHQIYLKLYDTPIRTIGNIISLLGWLYLIITSLRLKWKQLLT